MFKKNRTWLMLMVLIGLSLACDINAQMDKANKLMDDVDVITENYIELNVKANELFIELLGNNLTKVEDIKAYKEKNKSKFDELINLFGQVERLNAEMTDKYEQASKLKVPEKYKEYVGIKIQEFKKRNVGYKLLISFIKEFLQTNDVDKINKLMVDLDKQATDIAKEADKLSEKARQLAKDNPNVFKN